MKNVKVSEKELRYIYLKAVKGKTLKEKVLEVENQCKKINSGDHIQEVFTDDQKREVYKTPRMKKVIECLKSFN